MSIFKYIFPCDHTIGMTHVNCIYSGCDYVIPVLYVNVNDCSCGNVPQICVVEAIFMHAKERNLLIQYAHLNFFV